jgi:hypothetical protein
VVRIKEYEFGGACNTMRILKCFNRNSQSKTEGKATLCIHIRGEDDMLTWIKMWISSSRLNLSVSEYG